jgi:hypothetical protein
VRDALGSSQTITIETTPPGVLCNVDREAEQIGTITATPGTVKVGRSRKDLKIACDAPGFASAEDTGSPTFNNSTMGNVILGGVIAGQSGERSLTRCTPRPALRGEVGEGSSPGERCRIRHNPHPRPPA